MFIVFYR